MGEDQGSGVCRCVCIMNHNPLMTMRTLNNLYCPSCHSERLRGTANSLICGQYERNYPVMRVIINFKDASLDTTAGLSIEADQILTTQLGNLFGKLKTFNKSKDMFNLLRA